MASKFLLFFLYSLFQTFLRGIELFYGFVNSSFRSGLVSSIKFICRFLVGEGVYEGCTSVRFKAILCSDMSNCSFILGCEKKLISRKFQSRQYTIIFQHVINLLFGELTFVVNNNDAVGLSGSK